MKVCVKWGRKKEKHPEEGLGNFGKRIYKTRLPNEPTNEPTTERSGSLTAGYSRRNASLSAGVPKRIGTVSDRSGFLSLFIRQTE